jgi:excinuclease ABC subunit C
MKSYSCVYLSRQAYPRLAYGRGKGQKGRFFGPFRLRMRQETLVLDAKMFQMRQCTNIFFKQRQRPALNIRLNVVRPVSACLPEE